MRNFSLTFIVLAFLIIGTSNTRADVSVQAIVPGVCGNGVLEVLEQCDVLDFGGASCSSLGYATGTLACSGACSFVTDLCVATPPSEAIASTTAAHQSSGSRRIFPLSAVTLSGYAIPNTTVSVVWGGSGPIEATTDSLGRFNLRVPGLAPGLYTFLPQVKDQEGALLAQGVVAVRLESGSVFVGDIVLPPTLKAELISDSELRLYGYAAPDAELYLLLKEQNEVVYAKLANADGSWSYVLPLRENHGLITVGAWSMLSGHYSQLSNLIQIPAAIPGVPEEPVVEELPIFPIPVPPQFTPITPIATGVPSLITSAPLAWWWPVVVIAIIALLWYYLRRKN